MSYQVPDEKPSWKTTEFVLTLVSSLLTIAVIAGWVPQSDVENLNGLVNSIVEHVGVLVVNGIALWSYIKSRTEVKKVREELRVLQMRERLIQK